MNIKFASRILILCLAYTSCSNSQGVQIASSDIYTNAQGSTEQVEASILRADELFEAYTAGRPQSISLFILDAATQLKRNPSTELKDKPEAYLFFPAEKLSKSDTTLIFEAYKKRLGNITFLSLDSLGNVLYYDTGKRAPRHNYKETISSVSSDSLKSELKRLNSKYSLGEAYIRKMEPERRTNEEGTKLVKVTDLVLDSISTDIVYVKDLSEAQLLSYAMEDYTLNNNTSDSHFLGFLWLSFFYDYFDVNESTESITVGPKWLLNFSVIDAASLTLPDDFAIDAENLPQLKVVFNKDEGYKTSGYSNDGIRRHYLVMPRKDDYYTEKWKYISLDLADEFSFESKTFSQMVLIVNYLKSKYGNDVIKDLTTWYVDNGRGPLLITSFLKEKYDAKTNINELNQDCIDWISEKGQ